MQMETKREQEWLYLYQINRLYVKNCNKSLRRLLYNDKEIKLSREYRL